MVSALWTYLKMLDEFLIVDYRLTSITLKKEVGQRSSRLAPNLILLAPTSYVLDCG